MIVVCQACQNELATNTDGETSFQLINSKSTFIAGEAIQMQFTGDTVSRPRLWINNAFGSALLHPTAKDNKLTFSLPNTFTEKSGLCTWRLVSNHNVHASGKITIVPHAKRNVQIESYLGPPSITAGNIDYTMLVTAPVDIYDNPLADATPISVKKQFNTTIEEATVLLENGIAWKNLYSPIKSGRLLIAASSDQTTSKELTALVYPANATDFNIAYQSNHTYADGNQVITFSTDIIKDEFENIISDGRLVTFVITDSDGMRLHTTGTTINGIAKGQLLHPDELAKWSITAYITGAAQSNTITLDFESALKDFSVSYSSDGRTVSIANLQSFMEQLVPDGIPVSLEIKNDEGIVSETLHTTSRSGKAEFTISKDFYKNATYEFTISVAGIEKTNTVQLQ